MFIAPSVTNVLALKDATEPDNPLTQFVNGFCFPVFRKVRGRPIFQPYRPSTAEEKAKNLEILREEAKGSRWVPVVPGTIPRMGEGKWFMPDGKEYRPRKRGESD